MRLPALDSLRGIAALIVVLHHALLLLPGWDTSRLTLAYAHVDDPRAWVYLTPLKLLVSGPAAVLVFFVLSGLVLAMTFIGREADRYVPFAIKRLTRIWPAFAVTIVASAGLQVMLGRAPIAGTSVWFDYTWDAPLTPGLFAKHLAMLGTEIGLDNPMWSLVHEMRISLVFPILVAITLRNWRAALGGSMVAAVVAVKIVGLYWDWTLVRSLAMTVAFMFLFVGGIVIAMHLDAIRRFVAALPPRARAGLWLAVFAGLCASPDGTDIVSHLYEAVLLLVCGSAAMALVLLSAADGRASVLLNRSIPVYLGRISYSLYLVHVVVMVVVIRMGHDLAPIPVLIVGGILISIGLADLAQRYIEQPTTALGRRLARRLARSSRASAA